jgi:hypothetical protein
MKQNREYSHSKRIFPTFCIWYNLLIHSSGNNKSEYILQ